MKGLAEAVRRALQTDAEVRVGKEIGGGLANVLYGVQIGDSRAVVRMMRAAGLDEKAAREHAIVQFCDERGYPCVKVLAAGRLGDRAFLLLERVDAPQAIVHTLLPWSRRRTMAEVASVHARLHELDPGGFPDRVLGAAEWVAMISGHRVPGVVDDIRWLQERTEMAAFDDPRVCHLDFNLGNVLMRRRGHATVIDWDMAALTDPWCDVAFAAENMAVVPGAVPRVVRPVIRALFRANERAYLAEYTSLRGPAPPRVRYWRALYTVLVRLWAEGVAVAGGGLKDPSVLQRARGFVPYAAERFAVLTRSGPGS